jgi:hypothetical protein
LTPVPVVVLVKRTVSGAAPDVAEVVKAATGAATGAVMVIVNVAVVEPAALADVNRTV